MFASVSADVTFVTIVTAVIEEVFLILSVMLCNKLNKAEDKA